MVWSSSAMPHSGSVGKMPQQTHASIFDLQARQESHSPFTADEAENLKRIAVLAFLAIVAVEALVIFILLFVLPNERPRRLPGTSLKAMIVLGSGGHTAEMLKLVASLDKKVYNPRIYVAAETDVMSGKKAVEAEKGYSEEGLATRCDFYSIPRSREVGQSYFTSIFTTLRSQLVAAMMVWQLAPDVLLVNGPGTCIPLCFAAYLFRKCFIKHCDIVYVESIARVKSLSLSGTILYRLRLADIFLVQWPELQQRYPRSQFVDRLY